MEDEESRGGEGGIGGGEGAPLVPGGDYSAPPPGATSSRDAHLDNCKFFLMLVVIFNHCLQDFLDVVLDPTTKRQWCEPDPVAPVFYQFIRGVYLYLNLLGMPTFTLISGYCSKGFARCCGVHGDGAGLTNRSRRMVETLLVPWLIWQIFYLLYNYSAVYPIQFWSPIGITWYLSSLFMWRGSVQYLGGLRHLLPLTLVAGIAAGFTETPSTTNGLPFLDYQRFVAFLPIFYLGMMEVTPERLALLRSYAFPWGWGVTAATAALCCCVMWSGQCFDSTQRWVWMMTPYANDGNTGGGAAAGIGGNWTNSAAAAAVASFAWRPLVHAFYRGVFYVVAFIVGAAFLSVVPDTHAWYTDYGTRTMYGYLLHLLVIRGYVMAQEAWFGDHMPLWCKVMVSGVVLPAATGLGLMAPWCKKYTRWLVEPECGWVLWAPPAPPRAGAAER